MKGVLQLTADYSSPFPLTTMSAVPLQKVWTSHVSSAVLSVFVLCTVRSVITWYLKRRAMPPGPLGLPWIGNRHQMPALKPWRKFAEWNRDYGKSAVLLSDLVFDLLI